MSITTILLLLSLSLIQGLNTKGIISLDSWTFDKVIDGTRPVLVKFDKDYSYGEKENAWKDFAKRVGEMGKENPLLLGLVGRSEYGDVRNDDVHERFHIDKDNFPVFLLFHKSKEPIVYEGEVTGDALANFIKANTGIYIGAAGTLEAFDILAHQFMKANPEQRTKIITQAKEKATLLGEDLKSSTSVYINIMERVNDKGDGFIETEQKRVSKLKEGKLTEEKKTLFERRSNILTSFAVKEEL